MNQTVALFGEAEKGEYHTAYFCRSLEQLLDYFGNPPPLSSGLHYAVQVLLYHYNLVFLRVGEEGFSKQDYLIGFNLLEKVDEIAPINAIGLPGVGDAIIIQSAIPFCLAHHTLIIMNEPDLYDYLTQISK